MFAIVYASPIVKNNVDTIYFLWSVGGGQSYIASVVCWLDFRLQSVVLAGSSGTSWDYTLAIADLNRCCACPAWDAVPI